jgi:hypothetical protein
LDTEDERTVFSHAKKATVIFKEYRDRLGSSVQPRMHFDLQNLIPQHDLYQLDEPFTVEEIDVVIKHMPMDKVPGPDGFNGLFIKNVGISSGRIFAI